MADYAIHDTTLIGISNVIRKKEGSSALIDPAEYAERVNLMGMLEEKTASGSIVTFSDGADDVPTKSLKVTVAPTLSGVSALNETQTGRNLLPNKSYLVGANTLWIGDNSSPYYQPLKAGAYTVSLDTSETMTILIFENGSWIDRKYNATTATFVIDHDGSFAIQLYKSAGIPVINNWQLELGSTAHAYEPYQTPTQYTASLGRTIYGGTADIVNGEGQETHGKKVFDGTEGTGGTPAWTMISVSQGTMFRITVSDKTTTSATNTRCSYYTPVAQAQRADGTVSGAGTNVDIIDNRFSSVDEFKAWLAENPVTIVYELATPTDFTFTPIPTPETALGVNNFWADEGDTEVTYRSSGTLTPVLPTLISKTITENGTYSAEDDDADGYDEVIVNVPSAEVEIVPLNSPNPFVTISGITGTDIERTARTITAPSNGKYVFADDSTCRTNTGSGDGFFDIRKNDVSVVKQYMAANTTTPISIPEIEVETGDEIDIIVGFDNNHSSCNFQLYTGIAFASVATAPSLLSMGGGYSGSTEEQNETEETNEMSEYSENEEQGEEI